MKRKLVSTSALLGGCLAACITFTISCATAPDRHKAVELFNGKDLAGWEHVLADPQVPMEKVWTVRDGVLLCTGAPVGAIYKGPEITNFRLVVEYRWPEGIKPSNSGIFSRIHGQMKAIPETVETQLAHGSAGDVLGLQGRKIASDQPRFFEVKKHPIAGDIAGVKKLIDAEKPAGQWNRVEILAQGENYTVWVNNQLVNEAKGVEIVPGKVGVQSEGGPIEFRKITLTAMD